MTDKVDIWLPLYIGDYLKKTMHLTTEQHGAYMLLIMAYWSKRGPIQNNDAVLAGITRLSPDAWSMHKATLKQFFDCESQPGMMVHHRVEKELMEALKRKEKRTEKAKKAAKARWKN